MGIAQGSARFFAATMPAVGVTAGVVAFLLVVSGLALRWRGVLRFVRRWLLRRPQYDYRQIFLDHLENLSHIAERKDLYPAILAAACRIVGATGASLIVRDISDHFQMKASHGLKPFGFNVEGVKPFLDWVEGHREIVTRPDLIHSRECAGIKSEGLCYFVQFNAEVCVPLFISGRLYGVINMGPRGGCGYDSETRDFLKLLAVQSAIAIHNANLHQALVRQNRELGEASRFKTQLMSNLSHELRTPISSIIGLSELMSDGSDGELSEEQTRHLTLIRGSGMRLLQAVEAMLDISKLEVNKLDLDVQKVNIGRLAMQVVEKLKPNPKTTIVVGVTEETPGVWGDARRVHQVLKHLLDNAVKFTNRGRISVGAQKCGEMLKVSVRDTGPGIALDKQKMIFDGFSQVDSGMAREHEGLGLGLAISRKLVELHGGRLWLKSKPGEGSEFFFTLPLKPIGVFGRDGQSP